ncbi:MAG: CHAT domain-containing protein [Cyanobacteria bacterium P01_G01_bin.38]
MGKITRRNIGIHKLWRLAKRLPVAAGIALTTCLLVVVTAPGIASEPTDGIVSNTSAATLLSEGKIAHDAGQLTLAAQHWQSAAQLYEAQSDQQVDQALSLSYLSLSHQELGNWESAKRAVQQSLRLLQNRHDLDEHGQQVLAQVLNTYGGLQLAMGQAEEALATWQKAAQYYGHLGDTLGQLGSQINQAQAMQTLGFYGQAKTRLVTVQETIQNQPDTLFKATVLRSLGSVLQITGNLNVAQTLLEESLAITEKLDQPLESSKTQLVLANTLRAIDQPDAAIQAYESAITLSGNPRSRIGPQLNLLSLLVETQRWTAAETLTEALRSPIQSLQASRSGVYSRVNFVETVWRLQQRHPSTQLFSLEDLATLLATGGKHAQALQDERAEAFALGQLGQLYQQTQQWQSAKSLTQEALRLAQKSNAKDITYRWQWQLGQILKAQAQPQAAIEAYTQAVTSLKSVRKDLLATHSELQFDFREKVEPLYRELVSMLLASEDTSQTDLKQARSLMEDLQLSELENYFRSACIDAQSTQIDQIDDEAAVIYPIILTDRLEVVLSLPDEPLRHYRSAIAQSEVEKTVDQFFVFFNPALSDQQRLQFSKDIYDWLIRPAEASLREHQIKTLVFVLDGVLRNIPMAALHDGQHYLLENYAIALTPGLQLLGPHFSDPKPLQALMLGISEARQGFSALPGVKTEVQEIAENIQKSQIYLDKEFTKTTLQSQVEDTPFPILHLATHGQFSSALDNTFILAWDERITLGELDTLLKNRRIRSAHPIELMVLSACQTAEGDDRATLGLAGMAIKSGARSTLATLWSVNDESTVKVMRKFYELSGQSVPKAEALRQAQLSLLQDNRYEHPFFWAPFVLIGNWLT